MASAVPVSGSTPQVAVDEPEKTSDTRPSPTRPDPGSARSPSPFQLDIGSSRRSSDKPPPPPALSSPVAGSGKWRDAGRKIQLGLALSNRFTTLRDRYGVNEIEVTELKTVKKLGEGAFAVVEQCLYTPSAGGEPTKVACKKLKPEIMSHEDDLSSFMSEVSLMRKLKHQYIVEYIGVGSTDKSSDAAQRSSMFLVTELMEGGTLKRLVMKQMTSMHKALYHDTDALRWCIQVADALAYVHEAKPMIIHRDLKLENILLKGTEIASQEAKLADFGLVAFVKKKLRESHAGNDPAPGTPPPLASSAPTLQGEEAWAERSNQLMQRYTSMGVNSLPGGTSSPTSADTLAGLQLPPTSLVQQQLSGKTGTMMYMAPEMYRCEEYNEKVDVFSFGIIMYELLHKYMMVFAVSVQGTEQEIEQYAERVAGGWRPPLSKKFPEEVLNVIRDAWAQDPKSRPSMREILVRLKKIQLSEVLGPASPSGQPNKCGCTVS